ncbi:hypothetical protein K458DRAFT_412445 [Lentithecium fluviatile CBS 122367]|uniref:GIY-YIG domain-containing protein n=1 Tax=Lentithecium fluviatile CBS 122367 TaxID=1168545 RepID=A0A6G1JLM4_9PLEO|nr:hypothetical protein K458DRAFT_412445 [Lentithecium fluviatile CBS 122367]
MEELPEQLSTAQLEAQRILRDLIQKIKEPDSKYYARYGKWISRHPKLDEFCFRCVRPNVWRFLDGKWNVDALKSIGGDLKSEGRGIYFDGVLGLDKHTRFYVGQSTNLRFRISQHWNFRYRRDNPSLHYHAVQQSIYNVFGILAAIPNPHMGNHALPGMDCPDLLLNLLEMWMCLVFRCLPQQTLVKWLPEEVRAAGEFGALNIASPLDFGAKEREWADLSEWEDPLVQGYLGGERKRSSVVYRKNKQTGGNQNVIQVTAPTLLLVGAAVFAGFMLLRSGSGLGWR